MAVNELPEREMNIEQFAKYLLKEIDNEGNGWVTPSDIIETLKSFHTSEVLEDENPNLNRCLLTLHKLLDVDGCDSQVYHKDILPTLIQWLESLKNKQDFAMAGGKFGLLNTDDIYHSEYDSSEEYVLVCDAEDGMTLADNKSKIFDLERENMLLRDQLQTHKEHLKSNDELTHTILEDLEKENLQLRDKLKIHQEMCAEELQREKNILRREKEKVEREKEITEEIQREELHREREEIKKEKDKLKKGRCDIEKSQLALQLVQQQLKKKLLGLEEKNKQCSQFEWQPRHLLSKIDHKHHYVEDNNKRDFKELKWNSFSNQSTGEHKQENECYVDEVTTIPVCNTKNILNNFEVVVPDKSESTLDCLKKDNHNDQDMLLINGNNGGDVEDIIENKTHVKTSHIRLFTEEETSFENEDLLPDLFEQNGTCADNLQDELMQTANDVYTNSDEITTDQNRITSGFLGKSENEMLCSSDDHDHTDKEHVGAGYIMVEPIETTTEPPTEVAMPGTNTKEMDEVGENNIKLAAGTLRGSKISQIITLQTEMAKMKENVKVNCKGILNTLAEFFPTLFESLKKPFYTVIVVIIISLLYILIQLIEAYFTSSFCYMSYIGYYCNWVY